MSDNWPLAYQIQICDLRTWLAPTCHVPPMKISIGSKTRTGPSFTSRRTMKWGEHASVDHRVLFDVYTSTARMYLFLDKKPYACANLPTASVPSGPVTVTWGDALNTSSGDSPFAFHADHMLIEQRRHYDNLVSRAECPRRSGMSRVSLAQRRSSSSSSRVRFRRSRGPPARVAAARSLSSPPSRSVELQGTTIRQTPVVKFAV